MRAFKFQRPGVATACCIGISAAVSTFPVTVQAQEQEQAQVEEVIVSARKRDESVQDTPVSVTAFTATELSMRGAFNATDLFRSVPNVTAGNDLQIRGIGYSTRNIGIEGGATIYVDGVYTGRPFTFNQSLMDLRSLEVLRGPQGTLFGKNSIAGVINITTQLPSFDEFSGTALLSYANDEISREQLTLNMPVSDRAAFRVNLMHDEDGGYIRNLFNGRDLQQHENSGGRAAFRWAATDSLELTLRGSYFEVQFEPRDVETFDGVDPQTPPPRAINAPGPFTTVEDSPSDHWIKLKGASATLEYRLNDAFTLTSITGYEKNERLRSEGQDNSARNMIEIDFVDRQEHFTQELRGAGAVGKLDYVAGLFYFHQDSFQDNRGILGTDFAIPGLIPGGIRKVIDPLATIVTRSYAAFADVTYALTDALELEIGARVNREEKDFDFEVTTDAPALFYVVPHDTDSSSDTDFSPTAGVRYRFNDDTMVYARYAKGYKSGGWNADFASTTPGVPAPTVQSLRFEAEEAATVELGMKAGFPDAAAVLNVAVFYTDFSNLQVAQFNGINLEQGGQLAQTDNAGQATIKGAEVEASWLPVDSLRLSAGVGYLDAVYDRFDNAGGAGVSAAGKRISLVPRWTANASGQYSYTLSNGGQWRVRSDFSYVGERFGDAMNTAVRHNPSYWVANARIGYAAPDEKWQVYLWSNNVTDREYIQSVSIDQFAIVRSQPVKTVSFGRPITYGIEFQASF
jgi:iron complex outermembrane receptor protein